MKFFSIAVLLGLILPTDQQTTVFSHKEADKPKTSGYHLEKNTLAQYLRDPNNLPFYIPISLIGSSLLTIAEILEMHEMYPYNPDIGLYGDKTQQRLHQRDKTIPWVEEPTLFDLIDEYNKGILGCLDKIAIIAVCDSWEAPVRMYSEWQVFFASYFGDSVCLTKPLLCKEGCELVRAAGNTSFTPPKCAASFYKG
ncbi:hypothetical protein ABKA04_008427 [Annulohypoxylon sp. FPYF3050]